MKNYLFIIFILLSSLKSFSQNFNDRIIASANDWAQPIKIDLDQDGLTDLVSVSFGGSIAWWKKDNMFNYTKIIIDKTYKAWNSLDVYDIDGDSDLDILISEFDSVEIYYNDGNQNFSPVNINSNFRSSNIIAGDFDSDGIIDFITSSRSSYGYLKFWQNHSTTDVYYHGFFPINIMQVPIETGDILADDIDYDGDLDLVISIASGFWQGNKVICLLNDGQGNFTEQTINYNHINKNIQVLDYDNDGNKDLIIKRSENSVVLLTNDGNLNFTASELINDDNIGSMHIVDYDSDGDNDIAVLFTPSFDQNYFGIYINDGTNHFTLNNIDNFERGERIDSFDSNEDGLTDFLITSKEFDDPVIYSQTSTGFSKNILDDSFVFWSGNFYADDIDNDGLIDVVSASENEHELVLWHNDGSFNFTKTIIDDTEQLIEYAHVDDINSDGYKDILVTTCAMNQGQILLYVNDGNMHFNKTVLFNEANRNHVFSTDIDNDGDLDIVYSAYAGNGRIRYKRNDGNGNYQTVYVATLDYTLCVGYVDLNNDGYKDFITNKDVYYQNDGFLNFTEITLPASGSFFDIDGDHDLDMLSTRYDYDNSQSIMAWYENDGNGNFTENQIQTDVYTNGRFAIQDFDGDGDIDFIYDNEKTNNYGRSTLAYWENNGNQNFTKTIIKDEYLGLTRHLLTSDFDGDGDIDFLSSGEKYPFIIWENLSNSTLQTHAAGINYNAYLNVDGNVTIPENIVDGGSTGINLTFNTEPDTFDCTNLGDNIVTLTVTGDGGTDSCSATVTVIDNLKPSLSTQNIQLDLAGNASVSTTANAIDNGSSDNCGINSMTISQDTFTTIGNYTIDFTVTDNSTNSDTTTANIEVIDSTAEINEQEIKGLEIYPNPTNEQITIKATKPLKNVVISDILGKQIINVNPNKTEINLNLKKLTKGIYLITLKTDNAINIKKIIKK